MVSVSWYEQAKTVPLADVLQHLGIGHVRGRTCAPCPSCNAEQRGSSDKRGPLNIHDRDGGQVWRCWRCNVGGDGLDAVAWVLVGSKLAVAHGDDRRRVQAWFADRGWCDGPQEHRPPIQPPKPPAVRRIGDAQMHAQVEPPPADEVRRFWEMCRPLDGRSTSDTAPLFYLIDRGYALHEIPRPSPVRIAPLEADWLPEWWPSHWLKDFRLVFPAFTPDGRMASLHARRVPFYPSGDAPNAGLPCCEACGRELHRSHDPQVVSESCICPVCRRGPCECEVSTGAWCGWKPRRKTTWPKGYAATGLLFADAAGLALLRGCPVHRDTLVVEGVTDLLRAAIVAPRVPCAVIGFASGGAAALGDVRWPANARVGVATDPDKAGEEYADRVARAMPIRPRRIIWGDL